MLLWDEAMAFLRQETEEQQYDHTLCPPGAPVWHRGGSRTLSGIDWIILTCKAAQSSDRGRVALEIYR